MTVKETPLIFLPENILAILAEEKSQTRRIIKNSSGAFWDHAGYQPFVDDEGWIGWRQIDTGKIADNASKVKCRFGKRGDRIWCRESWRPEELENGLDGYRFEADNHFSPIGDGRNSGDLWMADYNNGKYGENWRPSMFMPRHVARLILEITEIQIQRVQQISEEDAWREAIEATVIDQAILTRDYLSDKTNLAWEGKYWFQTWTPDEPGYVPFEESGRASYKTLWNSLHAKPKPVYSRGEITHYESFPFDGRAVTETYRGLPWFIRPNPWVFALTFVKI